MSDHNILEVLEAIDPGALDYQEWSSVGMALKHEGFMVADWDAWSQRDGGRYRAGECARKWESFRGSGTPVTGGTIVSLAREQGWRPADDAGHELDWDSVIGARDEKALVDPAWVETEDVTEPVDKDWDPVAELITYLETLFEANENVGYVATTWEKDGKYLPTKGNWDRSAGELIQALAKCKGDIGSVIGDVKPEAGAWIRFNPLDGQGCKNDNVTEFRYALVESDTIPVEMQHALIRELELPVAALVHSGGKSIHAIVKVDATDYDEYRKRVDHLYSVCKKAGLAVDSQNKNPSRLSRMPGITRNGNKQYLLGTNIGRANWADWVDWMESETDVLPVDVTSFDTECDEVFERQPEIIKGILGTNEKMMLSSSSKAGKSVALLELCAAIAQGETWMGEPCTQGHALYVNFELKRESRVERVKKICDARGYSRESFGRMHFLDLRGLSAPLNQLMSKIYRQTSKFKCSIVVIDPIYKVMPGDENNAQAVSEFCNQLDAMGRMMDCSIVYCHHHSKGSQGQKSSMDRASGSGVFARDADAMLDMIELDVTESMRTAYLNECVCESIVTYLDAHGPSGWRSEVPQDAQVVARDFRSACTDILSVDAMNDLIRDLTVVEASVAKSSAHRLESTLRDFAPHDAINIWYRFPIHEVDRTGALADAKPKDMVDPRAKGTQRAAESAGKKRERKFEALENAIENAGFGEPPTTAQVMVYMGLDPKEDKDKFNRLIKSHGRYERVRDKATNLYVLKPKDESNA